LKDEQEPAESPPNTYTPQPDEIGKILWISGLTGMGKSTTAKILQEEEGFVNYEGNCFLKGVEPICWSIKKRILALWYQVIIGDSKKEKLYLSLSFRKRLH
jgi:hypothetical protein